MYKKGDLCVINSKTSHNNGKVVEVIGYTKSDKQLKECYVNEIGISADFSDSVPFV